MSMQWNHDECWQHGQDDEQDDFEAIREAYEEADDEARLLRESEFEAFKTDMDAMPHLT